MQQGRLFTWLSFRSARTSEVAQFSVGTNIETTPAPAGGTSWVVGGRYEWGLRREAAGWRITRLTLHGAWQDGNRELPALASRRVADERR
jgi:hypothetical protein